MTEEFRETTRQNTDTSSETFVGKKDEIDAIRMRVRKFAGILNERESFTLRNSLNSWVEETCRLHWFPRKGSHQSLPDGLRMYRIMREAYNRGLIHILLAALSPRIPSP